MSDISLDDAYEEVAETTTEVVEETETEETAEATEETTEETTEKTEVETTSTEKETEAEKPEKESWTFSQAMDEREKRQDAVKRAETAEAKLAELEGTTDKTSIFDNELKWNAEQAESRRVEKRDTELNMSQAYAEEVFGEDKVKEATEWMTSEGVKSPHVVNEFNSAKLPYHKLVRMFDAEQSRLDPDAAKAKMKAEIIAELKAEGEESSEKTEKEREDITPSLASKRSSGKDSDATTDDMEDMLGA